MDTNEMAAGLNGGNCILETVGHTRTVVIKKEHSPSLMSCEVEETGHKIKAIKEELDSESEHETLPESHFVCVKEELNDVKSEGEAAVETEQFNIPVVEAAPGRKRERVKKSKSGKESEKYRADDKVPKIDCLHNDAKYGCSASSLTAEEVHKFFTMVYKQGGKYEQDKFLIKYMAVSDPKRNRKRKEDSVRSRPVQVQYFVFSKNDVSVKVCAKSFRSITCVSKDRLNRLARTFRRGCEVLKEKRGGMDRARLKKHMEVTESIVQHILQYKCRESNYGRSKSLRYYLPPELSVKKMWRTWKSQQEKVCSYRKFCKIFMGEI